MQRRSVRSIVTALFCALAVAGCATFRPGVRTNDLPDPTQGYLLFHMIEDDIDGALSLTGAHSLRVPFASEPQVSLMLIEVPPGEYIAGNIFVRRGSLQGNLDLRRNERLAEPFEVAAGEILYMGRWFITFNPSGNQANLLPVRNYSAIDFTEMDELFPAFATLPRRANFDTPDDINVEDLDVGESAFRRVETFEPVFVVPPFHQAYATMTLLANLGLLEELDIETMDQLRATFFATFPAAPQEHRTLAEMAIGGYANFGNPLRLQLRIAQLNEQLRREGTQYLVGVETNLERDMTADGNQPSRRVVRAGLFNAVPSYNEAFVLFDDGHLVAGSVFEATADLDVEVAFVAAQLDPIVAINLSDTLVRDADRANDQLIPQLLTSETIAAQDETTRAVAALNALLHTVAQGDFDTADQALRALQVEYASLTEPTLRSAIDVQAGVVIELARRASAEIAP